jgi:F420-0:gamma-glutamyl ligase
MKKVLLLLVSTLILSYVGITLTLAQEAEKKAEAPAAAEKPKTPAVKPETLSGTLQTVVAEQKLVVVTDASGIPFNFKVTGATKIKVGGSKAKLADLSGATGKPVSVKFLAEKKTGDVAVTIEVQ